MRLAQRYEFATVRDPLVWYLRDVADPSRLTNQLGRWEAAVSLIERKHAGIIVAAPAQIQRLRREMIAKDGARRAKACGDRHAQRRYFGRALAAHPGLRNLVRWALNVNSFRQHEL